MDGNRPNDGYGCLSDLQEDNQTTIRLTETILTTAYRNTHRTVKHGRPLSSIMDSPPTRNPATCIDGACLFDRNRERMNQYKQCQVVVTKSYARLIARGVC